MSWSVDDLYNLLPATYQSRDAELGYPLRSLLAVIAEQAEVMESDIDRLYENWFIETCDDWVVPYIGQLLGLRTLNNVENSPSYSQRSRVGNLIGYRRRKGTPGMLEQLARDTTGWNGRVVEFFDLLITTQHYNHIRPHSRQTVDLRKVDELELINTPFDRTAHTVDVRNINQQNGWHNISNIGLFLWPLQSYYIQRCTATKVSKDYYFSQSGRVMPLFNRPRTETDEIHLADEVNTPGKLRRLPLCLELDQRRREIALKGNEIYRRLSLVRQEIIDNGQLLQNTLSDLQGLIDNRSTLFDKLLQELSILQNEVNDQNLQSAVALLHKVMIAVSDIKANYFAVQPVFQIFVKMQTDFYYELLPEEILICNSKAGWPSSIPNTISLSKHHFKNLVAVDPELGRLTFPDQSNPSDVLVSYAYGFSGDVGGGPYNRRDSIVKVLEPDGKLRLDVGWQAAVAKSLTPGNNEFRTIKDAFDSLNQRGFKGVGILTILDNQTYEESNLTVDIPDDSLLLIVSADWPVQRVQSIEETNSIEYDRHLGKIDSTERRAHIKNNLIIKRSATQTGNPGSVIIDGLLIDGTLTINSLNEVQINHSTVTKPCNISYCQTEIMIDRSILSGLKANASSKLTIKDSIVSDNENAVTAQESDVSIEKTTILGKVSIKTLNAANSIFLSKVNVIQKQSSCVRFSYINNQDAQLIKHFRCQPGLALSQSDMSAHTAILSRVVPRFASTTLFDPDYCQLSANCAKEIKTGAEDGSEMGVFSFLKNPQREANLKASLDEFLPLGLKTGVLSATLE